MLFWKKLRLNDVFFFLNFIFLNFWIFLLILLIAKVDDDRELAIKAAVVRIMKARKTLKIEAIITEVP